MQFHIAELWLKARQQKSIDTHVEVEGAVADLKSGELKMAGILGGYCRDKAAYRLPRY